MTVLPDPAREALPMAMPERWLSLPQPTSFVPAGGWWHPAHVTVVADDPLLTAEADRIREELTAHRAGQARPTHEPGPAPTLRLRVPRSASDVPPGGLLAAEGYRIDVGDDVVVTATTAAGAFRATRQMLHNLRAQGAVPRGRAVGAPSVAERGLHLDAARKHYGVEWIIALLHAAADVGINVFQWHFSDDEGFRIASDAFPEIVSEDHVTRDEAARVVEAARSLHIDLVPALDMPGHLRHVLRTRPALRLARAGEGPPGAAITVDGALDITNPDAVRFAHRIIDDLARVFRHSTHWNLGGDEFVDFARIEQYPLLVEGARERFGGNATGFDLLTEFVNDISVHLRALGLEARAWNDGMLRSAVVRLDPAVVLTWWTNWSPLMRPLSTALAAGHMLVNLNDGLLYYVLGEKAGYRYPTGERIWAADWHPGLFPTLPSGARQELAPPYPTLLRGCAFAVWGDDPDAQTPAEVAAGIRIPLRAMAERAWNGGSALTYAEFAAIDERIGEVAPGSFG